MKKRFAILLAVALFSTLSGNMFCACGGSAITQGGGGSTSTQGGTGNTNPTSAEVVSAIKNFADSEEQFYDFTFNLAGNINVGMFTSPDAHATYKCQYRFNSQTEELKFKRVTSGLLLYDSTEYIYSSGDSLMTVKMNDKGEVKKTEVESSRDVKLINLPFTELVTSLKEQDIVNITKSGSGYTAKLKLSSGNAVLSKLCGILGKMDTSINLKGVEFTNPVNGLELEFKMSGDKISDYALNAEVEVPVKGVSVKLNLTYSQKAASTAIVIPSQTNLIIGKTAITEELNAINAALNGVKTQTSYSLDLEAENEMDPGWNVKAIKDSYKSRLYKHTDDKNFTHFNNSYEYHSHHEEDGKETYKYTVGNLTDGTTHIVSRKGSNEVKPIQNVSADTQFEFMTKLFVRTAAETDCLKKSEDGVTTYTVYLSNSAILKTSEDIVNILNSNPADGVVTVENNFNKADYTVKDAVLTVVMKNGEIDSMELDTEIKYNPTSGDYTENNVTLNNRLKLTVNAELEKAQKYTSPEKDSAWGGLSGLNSSGCYIL